MNKLLLLMFSAISFFAYAQEEDVITDDELTRYAEVVDSIDVLTDIVSETVKEMVGGTEAISPSRYNDLYKISKDDEKLAAAEATEDEVLFLRQVDSYKDSMTSVIKTTMTSLAKDYVGDGGRTYNKIRRALKADTEVKARYDAILEEVIAARSEEDEPADEGDK